MKHRNGILRVGDIFRRLPGALRYVVPDPVHQILKFAAPESGIEDGINLELKVLGPLPVVTCVSLVSVPNPH